MVDFQWSFTHHDSLTTLHELATENTEGTEKQSEFVGWRLAPPERFEEFFIAISAGLGDDRLDFIGIAQSAIIGWAIPADIHITSGA